MLDTAKRARLQQGCVIPAHPLALDAGLKLDERHQRALTRYYLAAGAGGLAVGVHTTQFAIHDSGVGLYRPVLALAKETAAAFSAAQKLDAPIMIAGIVGKTEQAVREAELAVELGYDIGLLSLMALKGRTIPGLIDHCQRVAEIMPIMGFYLQSTLSGMVLPRAFWREFAEIPNAVAIKIAPFHRYQTLDVLEAVARSSRAGELALYTGNDDNITVDLLTQHEFCVDGRTVTIRIVGGLLGQWACWTKRAVEHLQAIQAMHAKDAPVPPEFLTQGSQLTLANKAIFDADNGFAGCIPGISYVLKHQGLLANVATLDPHERLSPGQAAQIGEIIAAYPYLTDDEFVAAHRDAWLRP